MTKFIVSGVLSLFISIMGIMLAWTITKDLEVSVIMTVVSAYLMITGLWLIVFAKPLGGE